MDSESLKVLLLILDELNIHFLTTSISLYFILSGFGKITRIRYINIDLSRIYDVIRSAIKDGMKDND